MPKIHYIAPIVNALGFIINIILFLIWDHWFSLLVAILLVGTFIWSVDTAFKARKFHNKIEELNRGYF